MAKPYREGKTWTIRFRRKGLEVYVPGFASYREAEAEIARLVSAIERRGPPVHGSPFKLTIADALGLYGVERLCDLKGAEQEARRINRYRQAAQLPPLVVRRNGARPAVPGSLFFVELAESPELKAPPASLKKHRGRRARQTLKSDNARAVLARLPVAHVSRYLIQRFMDALAADGVAPATAALERAMLRRLFNYARTVWHWPLSEDNPASGLKMRPINNTRDRVLTHEEEERLVAAIATCHNAQVAPAIILLLETAMRTSEPLLHARWGDVDWERCILRLPDAKAGMRDVPLSERAIEVLQALGPGKEDEPLVTLTYEALKAAWRRVCERADLKNLRLHDLRHTAATRMALLTGNVFLVQALTGHKTLSQLQRYVHVNAEDVVRVQRGKPPRTGPSGGLRAQPGPEPGDPAHVEPLSASDEQAESGQTVVWVNFRRTRPKAAESS